MLAAVIFINTVNSFFSYSHRSLSFSSRSLSPLFSGRKATTMPPPPSPSCSLSLSFPRRQRLQIQRPHVSFLPSFFLSLSHGVFFSMDSSLSILLVFNNTIQPELFRSVHVYCRELLDGDEREEEEVVVEREFVLSESGFYVEMKCTPILTSLKLCVDDVCEGYKNGVWLCVFAFHADHTPQFTHIPSILLFARNSKLKAIPNLLNDLQIIYKLELKAEVKDDLLDSSKEESQGNSDGHQSPQKALPVFNQDLNCLPLDEDTTELIDKKTNVESLPGFGAKKRRAQSDHIAKIALPDLVKYFDVPIVEASRNLNIGLTVLKRKCREFGIPRWPHRKIKSLDNLIHDLEEEAKHQEPKDKVAAMAMVRRQRMLECEKENMEKKPFMDIQTETKRFRQDVFKRRHRARAVEKHSSAV